ncbi:TlpA disulfide reductase family protein, partial [Janibacter terrae]|uniref:TlpA disulfide reductase family protein n=1 Tax=Janibacter terrae TaxID=103817 RepID=UPI001478EED3
MTARRPSRRSLLAAAGAIAATGGLAACSSSSAEDEQDLGYRSGDGSVTAFDETQRGEPVELAGETLAGQTWDSADHRGQVVVVNVWASWCGPCAKEAPHLVALNKELKGEDVQIVGI